MVEYRHRFDHYFSFADVALPSRPHEEPESSYEEDLADGDSDETRSPDAESDDDKELTLGDVVREVSSFVTSGVRAVLNVGRAYRRSLASSAKAGSQAASSREDSRTPLDCMWTLYCRNLDKTAELSGPYGFLAKLNGSVEPSHESRKKKFCYGSKIKDYKYFFCCCNQKFCCSNQTFC